MEQQNNNKKKSTMKRKVLFFLYITLGVPIIVLLLKIFIKTWRFEWENYDEYKKLIQGSKKGIIVSFWHCEMAGILGAWAAVKDKIPLTLLVSPSRDGEILARIVRKFGINTERGSSSKNPIASVLNLKRLLDKNDSIAIAIDGPRGPRFKVKPGVIILSKFSQCPILPVGIQVNKKIVLKSWDKTEIPLPFAKIKVIMGKSLISPHDAEKEIIEKNRIELEQILLEIKQIQNI